MAQRYETHKCGAHPLNKDNHYLNSVVTHLSHGALCIVVLSVASSIGISSSLRLRFASVLLSRSLVFDVFAEFIFKSGLLGFKVDRAS